MTANKLKKLLNARPYLVDSTFILSDTEAEHLLKKYGYPSVEAVIMKARSKSDLPHEAWLPFIEAINAQKREAELGKSFSRRLAHALSAHKRLAVAALIIMLLAGFFGLVPVGRAIAKEISQVIISLFSDGYEVKGESSEAPTQPYVEGTSVEFGSIAEFKLMIEKQGIVGLNASDFKLESVSYYRDATEETLLSVYLDSNGRKIELQQTWNFDTFYYGEKLESEEWHEAEILNGVKLNYYIYSKDKSFVGIAALDGSWLMIFAEPEATEFISGLSLQ